MLLNLRTIKCFAAQHIQDKVSECLSFISTFNHYNMSEIHLIIVLLLGQEISNELALHCILDKLFLGYVPITITVNCSSRDDST